MKLACIFSSLWLVLYAPLLAQHVDWDAYLARQNYPVGLEHPQEQGHLLSSLRDFHHSSIKVVIGARSGDDNLSPYVVQFTEGDKAIHSFVANEYTSFMVHGDILYYSVHSIIDCGAKLVAINLRTKKKLWTADVGLNVGHSAYANYGFLIEQYQDDAVLVFGKEMVGKYIYAIDTATGKVLAKRTERKVSNKSVEPKPTP